MVWLIGPKRNGNGHRTPDLSCLGLDEDTLQGYVNEVIPYLSASEREGVEGRIEGMVRGLGEDLGVLGLSLLLESAKKHQFGRYARRVEQCVKALVLGTSPSDRRDMGNPYVAEANNVLSDLYYSLNGQSDIGRKPTLEYGNLAYSVREK